MSLLGPISLSTTVIFLYITVPTLASSNTLNEYGLPRNSGGLSLISMIDISLLSDTVLVSESLIGSSANYFILSHFYFYASDMILQLYQ